MQCTGIQHILLRSINHFDSDCEEEDTLPEQEGTAVMGSKNMSFTPFPDKKIQTSSHIPGGQLGHILASVRCLI